LSEWCPLPAHYSTKVKNQNKIKENEEEKEDEEEEEEEEEGEGRNERVVVEKEIEQKSCNSYRDIPVHQTMRVYD
jgi:hypothetical protein